MRPLKLILLFFLPVLLYSQELSPALKQIEGQAIINEGLTGQGVKVGIIDGGFLRADERTSLVRHFEEDRVKYYKDFVTPTLAPYGGSSIQDDGHGTQVWEIIGGVATEKGIQFGLATEAAFYLARTDHAVYEKRQEEQYMIQAIDEMARQGVRVINISLGYTNGYSRKSENYTKDMIDGKSSWITRSVDSLLAIHDILLVVSAGNDGQSRWRILSAPADSKNVLSVGASKLHITEEMNYSSIGPKSLQYVKPEISCFATSGTSFSAPLITGLVACMLEKKPDLTNAEIIQMLQQSASLFPYPNNRTGFGIPNAAKLLQIMEYQPTEEAQKIETKKEKVVFFIDDKSRNVIYHKSKDWRVIKKEVIRSAEKLKIKRFQKASSSTVVGDRLPPTEIIWLE